MHRNIKLLALFSFFADLDFLGPIAIIYFSKVSGSFILGMSIFSLVTLSSALFEIPTGIFSDRIGRKKTIIYGAIAGLFANISLVLGKSYIYLAVSAILLGLARSFYSGNNEALLYDSLHERGEQNRYHVFLGKIGAIYQISAAISAVIGGIIANKSFSLVIWIAVFPKILMLLISFFLTEPKIEKEISGNIFMHLNDSIVVIKKNFKLKLLISASSFKFAIGESTYVFRNAFIALLWPIWAIGFINAFSSIGAAISYYFSGKLIDKFKPYKVLNAEIIYCRIINLFAYSIPTVLSPVFLSLTSLTYGVSDIAMQSLLQNEFTDAQRATLGSAGALVNSLAFTAASLLLGYTADLVGPVKTLIIAQFILLVPLIFYRKIFQNKENISVNYSLNVNQ